MPDETEDRNHSSNQPEQVSPNRRQWLARAWDNDIPLWQKLVVWVGAASVIWINLLGSSLMLLTSMRGVSAAPFVALSLALSAGLWIWPLARGGWRIVALVLAVPATLEFLIGAPAVWHYLERSASRFSMSIPESLHAGLGVVTPVLAWTALAIIWIQTIRDLVAWRRARRARHAVTP